ncbi:MAG TPA: hypothetical protein VGV37_24070 [Aliidongia sp.]|uniref:hypothetical protein n=1 Tax=Aliidongia sp. TaxID=1914230 RepID=UPI002DDD71DC|nr:hypothetical protein [Aliidongia sp.]HEV2677629.1 hypothetical protein [Aliidongia sp.]
MDGHDILGGILAVKAAVDTLRTLGTLPFGRKGNPGMMPVFRLVVRPAGQVDRFRAPLSEPSRGVRIEPKFL